MLNKAVYGLTELYREEIRRATLVANPGCYPTATLLALAPLLKGGFIDGTKPLFIDSMSGVSGAGKGANGGNAAMEVEGNIIPYKIGNVHQHIPEMEQEIEVMFKKKIPVTFSPHLCGFKYGIISTHYLQLKDPFKKAELYAAYEEMYGTSRLSEFAEKTFPEVISVEATNFCDIGS